MYLCAKNKKEDMELRNTFQSIIALHQREFPLDLQAREMQLPLDGGRIVTVTGIRRCGKSSLLGLTINRLLESGVPKERILYVGFDDERFLSMTPENFDELLQAYREMYPMIPLQDVYMFLTRYNWCKVGNSLCSECIRTIASISSSRVALPRCSPRRWLPLCVDGLMNIVSIR